MSYLKFIWVVHAVQTLQNARALAEQAGTSSIFSSAISSYPKVQACQQSAT
jgi:hypothetical protein